MGSIDFVAELNEDYPHLVICEPVGPSKMKRRPKIATQIRFGTETSIETGENYLANIVGS